MNTRDDKPEFLHSKKIFFCCRIKISVYSHQGNKVIPPKTENKGFQKGGLNI